METVKEKQTEKQKLKPPSNYNVILINDDFTPMDFVVSVLVQLFNHPIEKANKIMLDIHNKGEGVAGSYTKEIAETRVAQVNNIAQHYGHPLKADIKQI